MTDLDADNRAAHRAHNRGHSDAQPAQPALQVSHLTVTYGKAQPALDNVSFELVPGTITGLIGVNGAGKSTLFNAIMGLVPPVEGKIHAHCGARSIAYVPQYQDIDWNFPLSVRSVVASGTARGSAFSQWPLWGGRWRGRSGTKNREIVDHALAQTQLTELAHRQIGQLSGGQKKRAFVARGIAQQASIMLLDEPFAGVDNTSRAAITSLLLELADAGTTILVSTHDLGSLPDLCPRAILLKQKVVADGPVSTVLQPDILVKSFGEVSSQ